jgi:hypothetical protein
MFLPECERRDLIDDPQNVDPDPSLIAGPPLELWPEINARTEMPDDVHEELLAPIRDDTPA